MSAIVLKYKPETGLFVPDIGPINLYRAIAEYGVTALTDEGTLYFETNPLYIYKVKAMLSNLGYKQIKLKEDQFGKQRFVKAMRG